MRQKLLLFGESSLLMQRISFITSLILAMLTVGSFFLTTFTINDLSIGQKDTENATVADAILKFNTTNIIGGGSNSRTDKNISCCLNNRFHSSTINGKERSSCYFVSDNHWDNDDGGHYDEEDSEVCEEEDRENEYVRKDALECI